VTSRGPRALAVAAGGLWIAAACASSPPPAAPPAPLPVAPDESAAAAAAPPPAEPVLPPHTAMLLGLLPRRTIGAEQFVTANATYDGRGVLIAILDSGIDAGLPGLRRTTTGDRKLADLRDFSGEGQVALAPVVPRGDTVTVDGQPLTGFGRVVRLALPPYYAGVLVEARLGQVPAADVNGDGDAADRLPIVVARASDGWFLVADTNGDGSLADEAPVRDYATAAETFSFGPMTLAANFATAGDRPSLDLVFDNSGHGSHVAGIAAGHDLFGIAGFDGIAPGATLLGLKIADDARGGVTVSGSILEALEYATRYAERGGLPLVVNLSYGVGNDAVAGRALIDSLLDAFAVAHPDLTLVISAGNDGPGIATTGFPGSAELALAACALFPGVFAKPAQPGERAVADVVGWWSSRGGDLQKPDLCVPGVAFSNVPPWDVGHEVAGGTSMAAPQLSGAAALLQSAALQNGGRPVTTAELSAALKATARAIPGATTLDDGAGVPDVPAAWRWLHAGHRAGRFTVRALADGANRSRGTAAYRRDGLASPADTLQRFAVTSLDGQPFARLLLRSDAAWLRAPLAMEFDGAPDTVALRYDSRLLQEPGLHVGTVWALPATDTLGGAAFGLTNTIVVPYALDLPFSAKRDLKAGQSGRFYFRVPPEAGGLIVQARVVDPGQHTTLYLFAPSGRPLAETPSGEAGGEYADSVRLAVRQEDLQPGVYEAVAVAPPDEAVTVAVEAALPLVQVATARHDGVTLASRSAEPVAATVAASVLGAARSLTVSGRGTERRTLPLAVPDWADQIMLDVRLGPAVWSRLTDFAVSLWDTAGHLLAESPLDHTEGRQYLRLAALATRDLTVELIPAFALAGDSTPWNATVTIALLQAAPPSTPTLTATVPPGGTAHLPWSLPAPPPAPDGFAPYVAVSARGGARPPAVLRVMLPAGVERLGGTP
jgi:tripeptidyl-peptidase-2